MDNKLTKMFTSYPKFMKQLFKDFNYSQFGFPRTTLFILLGLRYHSKGESLKMSELEMHAGLKKSTLSESVNILVENGYVERKRSERDRRVVNVKLSEKGKEKIDEISKIIGAHIHKKLEILSNEESKKLFESFESIENVAEKLKGSRKNAQR